MALLPMFVSALPLPLPRSSLHPLSRPKATAKATKRNQSATCSVRSQRRRENVPGNVYVDSSCIDCDTCRWMCPSVFHKQNGQSAVHAQPSSQQQYLGALQAAVACPTGSIRTEEQNALARAASDSFPIAAVDGSGDDVEGVYFNGFTSRRTFAALSWLVMTTSGAVMVDCPRFSEGLARSIEKICGPSGVQYLLLSHRDDVHGHEKWARRLNAQRVIHHSECNEAQQTTACEMKLYDDDFPYDLMDGGLTLLHVPGHTRGSIAMLDAKSKSIFSGDHMWSSPDAQVTASPRYCSYSWTKQLASISNLADVPFLHIWPGHGRPHHFADDQQRRLSLLRAVEELQ